MRATRRELLQWTAPALGGSLPVQAEDIAASARVVRSSGLAGSA